MSDHKEFTPGTRVKHQFHSKLATVKGPVRTNGGKRPDDVLVRFDDGMEDFCHLKYMTVVEPAVVNRFPGGSRVNHRTFGHGTVVDELPNMIGGFYFVRVKYDNNISHNQLSCHDYMQAIPALVAPEVTLFTRADLDKSFEEGKLAGQADRENYADDAFKRGEKFGYADGCNDGVKSVEHVDSPIREARRDADTANDRLRNELYHDRARLERVVANATKLSRDMVDTVADFLNELYPGNTADLTQTQADLVILAGKLAQFADTHGE